MALLSDYDSRWAIEWQKHTQKYDQFAGQGAKLGLIKGDAANIEQYVTDKALDGLYLMIGEEERAIRQNPLQAGSAIVSKVFGALK